MTTAATENTLEHGAAHGTATGHGSEPHGEPSGLTARSSWTALRLVLATALGAYVLAMAGLAKAKAGGGRGAQIVGAVVAGLALLLGIVAWRAACRRAAGGTRSASPRDQRVAWLAMIRVGAVAAVALSAFACIKANKPQFMPVVMLVLSLWVMSVAARLDSATRRR